MIESRSRRGQLGQFIVISLLEDVWELNYGTGVVTSWLAQSCRPSLRLGKCNWSKSFCGIERNAKNAWCHKRPWLRQEREDTARLGFGNYVK